MKILLGMILGALLLSVGVYTHDAMQTSAGGEQVLTNRQIVNWDVAKADWDALLNRAHNGWVSISS